MVNPRIDTNPYTDWPGKDTISMTFGAEMTEAERREARAYERGKTEGERDALRAVFNFVRGVVIFVLIIGAIVAGELLWGGG